MAFLKHDSYSGFRILTGDDAFDSEHVDHLRVTPTEIITAINAENLTDRLFARILTDRSKAHRALADKIPGATID